MSLQEIISEIERLKVELDSLRPFDKETVQRIEQTMRLWWNYHSNAIEGNSLTYGETKMLILHGITAQGKPMKDFLEVKGHDEAVKWAMDMVQQKMPLTEKFIRELHEMILKEPYEVDAITPDGKPTKRTINIGKYKTTPNHVKTKTGEIFRFASPEETPAMMDDLMDWYNKEIKLEELSKLEIASIFHYRFVRIHPFDDGNGRMARLLMNFILMQFGYPPVIIKTEEKRNYLAALEQSDVDESLEPFIQLVGDELKQSLEIYLKGVKGESIEEEDDWNKRIELLKKKSEPFKKIDIHKKKFKEQIEEILNVFLTASKTRLDGLDNFYHRITLRVTRNDRKKTGLDLAFGLPDILYEYHVGVTSKGEKLKIDYEILNLNYELCFSFSFNGFKYSQKVSDKIFEFSFTIDNVGFDVIYGKESYFTHYGIDVDRNIIDFINAFFNDIISELENDINKLQK